MSQKELLSRGTILNFSQDSYLWTWAESFLIACKAENVAKGTLKFYRVKLRYFLDYCDSQAITQFEQLTPDVLRRFLLSLEEKGHNPGGIHAAYRALRTFLNWWEDEVEPDGWKNPIRKVKSPHDPEELLDPVEVDEVEKLVDACRRDWHGDRDRAILLTLLDTGLRAGELCALDLSDLDLPTNSLIVRQGKGRKPRAVFFGKRTRRAIRAWLKRRGANQGPLFMTLEGERLGYDGLRAILTRRSKKGGIMGVSLHDFRRAFCLAQLQAGVPETTIARLMGHTTTQLIARYAKQSGNDLGQLYRSPVDGDIAL